MDKTQDTDKSGRRHMDLRTITKVSFSQVVALARAIDEHGGVADVARIADDVEMDPTGSAPSSRRRSSSASSRWRTGTSGSRTLAAR